MGSSQFSVPTHIRQGWQQLNIRGTRVLRNKNTQELFNFLVLSKLSEQHNVSQLIERSIYSLPGTPKVIILNDQSGELFILVQTFSAPLADLQPRLILPTDILDSMLSITRIFHALYRHYGPFKIRENMLGLSQNMTFMGWIHSDLHKTEPEIPLVKTKMVEKEMIQDLLGIAKKVLKVQLNGQFPSFATNSFEQFSNFLTREIQRKKYDIVCKLNPLNAAKKAPVRPMSPQNSFGSLKMAMTRMQSTKDISIKAERKNNLPQFLQKNKERQIQYSVLDSINHRRTMTIEQQQTVEKNISSKSKNNKKRELSPSKPLNRVRSLKTRQEHLLNNTQGYRVFPKAPRASHHQERFDGLTSTGSSGKIPIQKKQFHEFRPFRTCENIELVGKNAQKGDSPDISLPAFNLPSLSRDFQSSFFDASSESCIFQNSPKQADSPASLNVLKLDNFPQPNMVEAKSSKYKSDIRTEEVIVEEQSRHDMSKNLEDELNDFFSNPSKSPRFMLGPLNESLELEREFKKIIDL